MNAKRIAEFHDALEAMEVDDNQPELIQAVADYLAGDAGNLLDNVHDMNCDGMIAGHDAPIDIDENFRENAAWDVKSAALLNMAAAMLTRIAEHIESEGPAGD